jgi:hypothetical protein
MRVQDLYSFEFILANTKILQSDMQLYFSA